jgi:hypothetical protein
MKKLNTIELMSIKRKGMMPICHPEAPTIPMAILGQMGVIIGSYIARQSKRSNKMWIHIDTLK